MHSYAAIALWGVSTASAAAAAAAAAAAPAAGVTANVVPRQNTVTATASSSSVTAITGCHLHATDLYCMAGETEYHVDVTITATSDVPAQYTDCHAHGSDMYCVDKAGEDVAVHVEGAEEEEGHDHGSKSEGHDHGHDHGAEGDKHENEASGENKHCHFHAGVEHCTGGSEESTCEAPKRDYKVGLRVGLLFVILATSAIGVYAPILLQKLMSNKANKILIVCKQFGTGIIISTAFVHLYTHASMMFTNDCIGDLGYEGVTSAIVMAGIFLSFIVEYIGHRVVTARIRSDALDPTRKANAWLSAEVVSILVMEIGIIFHSLLIGLTLVVAGDSFFITLFVVILFHQMFEGVALGSRIATIGTANDTLVVHEHRDAQVTSSPEGDKSPATTDSNSQSSEEPAPTGLTMRKKLGLAGLYAFITPIGMAIGIGVLDHFNGNDRATLIAIGTLDAVSAGILIWVGLVEMWAADWMTGAHGRKPELADADVLTTALAFFGLIAGLALMSLLGKWA